MTDTLQTLLERLENADGPDIKLAHDLALALGAERKEFDVGDGDEEWWLEWPDGERVQNFTASLDASIELVERVLPGWQIELTHFADKSGWANICPPGTVPDRTKIIDVGGNSTCLSLLTAMTKALIAEQE